MSALESSPRITPFLWFDSNAEEAVDFYLSVFKNSRRISELRSTGNVPLPEGSILAIGFELDGQKFTALNGGPRADFNDSVSFVVNCECQQEIDHYWDKLTAGGGAEIACGWLKDKYGVRWQIVPSRIFELVSNPKAMNTMMGMKKLNIAELERAAQN